MVLNDDVDRGIAVVFANPLVAVVLGDNALGLFHVEYGDEKLE